MEDIQSRYFVRMQVEDRYGVLASVASVFGNNSVSIAQMVQKEKKGELAEIVVITDSVKERHFQDSLKVLGGMSVIREISSIIRVYWYPSRNCYKMVTETGLIRPLFCAILFSEKQETKEWLCGQEYW